MNHNYLLSQLFKAIFIFLITVNAWAVAEPTSCSTQAQILNQSDSDSADDADEEEDEEEPECD